MPIAQESQDIQECAQASSSERTFVDSMFAPPSFRHPDYRTTPDIRPTFGVNTPTVHGASSWPSRVKANQPPILDVENTRCGNASSFFGKSCMHVILPDSYLLIVVDSVPSSVLGNMVMGLFRDTRMSPESRTLTTLLGSIDKTYALSGRERGAESMERFSETRREHTGAMQSFWIRFGLVMSTLGRSTSLLPSELLFTRALESLRLSFAQKSALLTFLGMPKLRPRRRFSSIRQNLFIRNVF